MLRRRGVWDRIDEVVWAVEGESDSPGNRLGRAHGVKVAPFFVVDAGGAEPAVYTSGMKMLRDLFPKTPPPAKEASFDTARIPTLAEQLAGADPVDIVRFGLDQFGERLAIAFSGAEDVVLIDLATRLDLPFRVFTVDTGRLHAETYEYLDEIHRRFGVTIETWFPDADAVSRLTLEKGPNPFLRDGHAECCAIRKVAPLRRALAGCDAWMTGLRRDQSPATRGGVAVVEADTLHAEDGRALVKLNPLARWTHDDVWRHIREHALPTNPLHERGFRSIGCEPCTRPTGPEQAEREGRWWWEQRGVRESGMHRSPGPR
jgi:phosphoadenosine phosphosulfate reductase